jgi:hypothetical protein
MLCYGAAKSGTSNGLLPTPPATISVTGNSFLTSFSAPLLTDINTVFLVLLRATRCSLLLPLLLLLLLLRSHIVSIIILVLRVVCLTLSPSLSPLPPNPYTHMFISVSIRNDIAIDAIASYHIWPHLAINGDIYAIITIIVCEWSGWHWKRTVHSYHSVCTAMDLFSGKSPMDQGITS